MKFDYIRVSDHGHIPQRNDVPASPSYIVVNSQQLLNSPDKLKVINTPPDLALDTNRNLLEGRYEVIRTLDRGGQTTEKGIREVRDVLSNTIYALKTYVCTSRLQFHERGTKFNREVAIMARLHHSPHVVDLIRCHSNPHTLEYSFTMSPVANQGNLTNYMAWQFRYPFTCLVTDQFLRRALIDLASGLRDIHEHSVRHKDIKPGNILVHNDRVMYTDFGLSLDYTSDQIDMTNCADPELDCTLAYAAPETFSHTPRNRKSDIFCLGIIFLELLCTRAVAITGNADWGNNTFLGNHFQKYSDMVLNGRVGRTLDWMAHKEKVSGLKKYVTLVRSMVAPIRDERPDAETVKKELILANGAS